MAALTDFDKILRSEEPLAQHMWLRLGGPAQYLAEPNTVEELAALVRRCREEDLPVRLLGGGSNILVRDEGVRGVVIRLTSAVFCDVAVGPGLITAGGGTKLGHVIATAVRAGLGGLEALVGIPGTVGGALRGNAGSRGGDIGQWTNRVTLMAYGGEVVQRNREDLVFSYRESNLDELVILSAQFQLEEDDPEELTKRMQKQWIVKKANQPLAHQNSACIFKNPRGMSAGMLIEQAGLKGMRVGGAEVSERHANFFIAHPGATAADMLGLIELVRDRVAERLGVELQTEIEIW